MLVTFGSMPLEGALNMQRAVLRLTQALNTRVIVVQGWGFDDTTALSSNPKVKIIRSAPYDKLMPLVKAVVHHGGLGTTAECLRTGRPGLPCPVIYPFGDQHFWGMAAHRKGYALRPLPLKELTEDRFIAAVNTLLTTELLYDNCRCAADLLKAEDGPANAIQIIEKGCFRSKGTLNRCFRPCFSSLRSNQPAGNTGSECDRLTPQSA